MDFVYLLLTGAFFAATALLIIGCEALRGRS